ncbi:hypothetical protein AB0M47_02160 [Hamadaea sp. NPDC051192]|uniref:hypothetical protein n=1 Tax=Hamadaea sp. NPDC051192 TaxID=3154940 RepID=UPI003413E031
MRLVRTWRLRQAGGNWELETGEKIEEFAAALLLLLLLRHHGPGNRITSDRPGQARLVMAFSAVALNLSAW